MEDDRQLADLTTLSFPSTGFAVRTCYSGPDALQEVEKKIPDLMILDVVMPGMDGWEVLLKLKSNPKTAAIPVIMCTGKDSMGDVEKSFNYGAQAYVIKPIDVQKLLKKVSAILDTEDLMNG